MGSIAWRLVDQERDGGALAIANSQEAVGNQRTAHSHAPAPI